MANHPSLYLAGPDVFLAEAMEIGARKRDLCRAHGFEGLFPLDNAVVAGPGMDRRIYAANMALIHAADAGIFNLTPFRGVSADPGTVFELGAFIGLGKPVFAYTNVVPDLFVRVREAMAVTFDGTTGLWRDASGMFVEDFGNADNLMIDAALATQGRQLHRMSVPSRAHFTDISGFVACLGEAQKAFGAKTRAL